MKIHDHFREEEKTRENGRITVKRDGESVAEKTSLLFEHELSITINELEAVRLVCTASDLVNLVVGRLISEGFAEDTEDIDSIYICESGNRARVFLTVDAWNRIYAREEIPPGPAEYAGGIDESSRAEGDAHPETVSGEIHKETESGNTGKVIQDAERKISATGVREVPTCCTDNMNLMAVSRPLRPIEAVRDINPDEVFRLVDSFVTDGELHRGTGGTHSAYLMYSGETVYSCEDIGRHNALDKAIGEMFVRGYEPSECLIYTTGRVPTDMVRKAVRAGIGGLVSKSVPTVQAVELAEQYGLKLYFRAWPDSYDMPI